MLSVISQLYPLVSAHRVATFLICIFGLSSPLIASCEPSQLMVAIESGDSPEIIKQLIESGEDVNEVYAEMLRAKKPVLRYALDRGTDRASIEIITYLIRSGADVNASTYNRVPDQNVYGMMPLLSYAVLYSSPEVVEILVNSGADVHFKLNETSLDSNKTPLTFARELDKFEVVDILLKAGALF